MLQVLTPEQAEAVKLRQIHTVAGMIHTTMRAFPDTNPEALAFCLLVACADTGLLDSHDMVKVITMAKSFLETRDGTGSDNTSTEEIPNTTNDRSNPVNQAVVTSLEQLLEKARKGNIVFFMLGSLKPDGSKVFSMHGQATIDDMLVLGTGLFTDAQQYWKDHR